MNTPPPAKTLPLKVEHGDPLVVRFEHAGQKYTMRVTNTVLAVWPTGVTGLDGLPTFNVQMAPIMAVSKESKP